MQSDQYSGECLKEALKILIEANRIIYASLVPVAMIGELKQWNDSVPIGEIHNFDFDLFKNCTDANIQLLAKILEKVDESYHR